MSPPVFRFAPSPNGELHLGHAYSALLNAELARKAGGRFLLRMEDIDLARTSSRFEAHILEDLRWLGIAWEDPVRRQSEHFDDYAAALERLAQAELVYPAFMTRSQIRAFIANRPDQGVAWPRDPDGVPHYPGIEKRLSIRERRRRIASGEPFAWRLDMAAALQSAGGRIVWRETGAGPAGETGEIVADPACWGDVILARVDTPTSYHLAVTLDDAIQGVTHVVRGRDLFHATAVHRLLQHLLGLPEPVYHHHRLILGRDGRKLSKSLGSAALRRWREAGRAAEELAELVGPLGASGDLALEAGLDEG
jgi:glutamyl-Q tRNA(Asp) synthetase